MTTSHNRAMRTANLGVAMVAVTAAVISFSHVRTVAVRSGESQLTSWLLPVSIDGAVVAAVSVLLADSRAGRRPAALTWLLLGLGLSASMAANVASAEPAATARAVAAWPPIALALGIEVLAGLARRAEHALPEGGVADAENVVGATAEPLGPDVRHHSNGRAAASSAEMVLKVPLQGAAGGSSGREAPIDDAAAIVAIRELDRSVPAGRASRLEIQKTLQCGGSRAARLAELARK